MNLSSIQKSDHEIIDILQEIYGPIQYDCTYNKGSFWSKSRDPEIIGDIAPRYSRCREINIESTDFDSNSINSVIYDPPFIVKKTDIKSRMMERYGYFKTSREFFEHIDRSIREISRILVGGGFLIVKIQDVVDGSRRIFPHIRIANMAGEYGLELRDIFIKVSSRLQDRSSSKLSRANHCYFMVFVKCRRRIRVCKF